MRRGHKKILGVLTGVLVLGGICSCGRAVAQEGLRRYKIGVLATRGKAQCYRQFSATADYLNQKIPHALFEIVPLDFREVVPAVRTQQVDFLLTNPLLYVDTEILYGVRCIATLSGSPSSEFHIAYGGGLFIRADRKDIKTFSDLKGKSLMAVHPLSLGGWLAGYEELMRRGVDPFRSFSKVDFAGIEDEVVMAVLAGKVDVGIVKTELLEDMAKEGKIDLDLISVLQGEQFVPHAEIHKEYRKTHDTGHQMRPFTHLYPAWPLAKVRNTDEKIAKEVVIALLDMEPDDYAVVRGEYSGWVTPLCYEPVHALMRKFGVGAYAGYGKVTLRNLFDQYGLWLITLGVLIVVVILAMGKLFILNWQVNQNKKKYQKLFTNMPSAMAVYKVVRGGEDFLFQEYNHAAEIITGGTLAEFYHKSVRDAFPGVEAMGLWAAFQRVYRTGVPEILLSLYEDQRLRLWVHNVVYKLSETEIVSIYDDVTNWIKAEEEIKTQNAFLTTIINSFHYPLYVFDVKTRRVVLSNKAAEAYKEDEFSSLLTQEGSVSPEAGASCLLEIVRASKKDFTAEQVHCTSDGTMKIFEVVGTPMLDAQGDVSHVIEYAIDVTSRRQMEGQLKSQKDLFANLLARIPCDVYWKDINGKYFGCNISYAQKAGLSAPENIIGKTDADLPWEPEEVQYSRETDQKVVLQKKAIIDFEETKHIHGGQPVYLLSSKVPLINNKDEVIGVLGISTDISDRKKEDELKKHLFHDLAKVNQELRETQEQLLQSEKMSAVGQLSAGVAHEIKNPLAIIALSIESFEMIQPDLRPELKERLKMVKDAVTRANKVVGDLLSFSRQSEMRIVRFDFKDMLLKALDFAKKKSIMKNIQYVTRFLQEDGPVMMEGDPVLITQVVLNVLSNAIDAIADEGGITLETDVLTDGKTGHRTLEMKVIDTGCGMPPQVVKRIFEPFYTTKDQGEGTGLGLSLVYKIIERHEGSIEVDSEEGKGTTVTVRLPLKTGQEEEGGRDG